jgi:hypothetical protein
MVILELIVDIRTERREHGAPAPATPPTMPPTRAPGMPISPQFQGWRKTIRFA